MLDPELRALMVQTVTLREWLSDNTYGAPQYGTPVTCEARVERKVRLVKGPDGRDVLSNTQVYLGFTATGGPPVLTPRTKVTLPDSTEFASILFIESLPDETGTAYTQVVSCG